MPTVSDQTAILGYLENASLRWNVGQRLGTPVIVSYNFLSDDLLSEADVADSVGVDALWSFNETQRDHFRHVLDIYEAATGVVFVETQELATLSISGAVTDEFDGRATLSHVEGGNAGRSLLVTTETNMAPGSFGFLLLLHELGHTLGLRHPHEGLYRLEAALDTPQNTVMSYRTSLPYVTGLGPFDLAALRQLYGDASQTAGWRSSIADDGMITIHASDRSESITTTSEPTRIFGRSGNDRILGRQGNDHFDGGDGADTLRGAAGDDTLIGGFGADSLVGWRGADLLIGGEGSDSLMGDGGSDTIFGGSEADLLSGSSGDDSLSGGTGRDSLSGGHDDDTLLGGSGADDLQGDDGHDSLEGGGGADLLDGGRGRDALYGQDGRDTLIGGDHSDTLSGGNGRDVIRGGDRADLLLGGNGGDLITGDAQEDTIYAGDGNDTVYGGEYNDVISGGAGNDLLVGGFNYDRLFGGSGDDRMTGNLGTDYLSGGLGNDQIFGGQDADTLLGGVGDDTIYGGQGGDTLTGGSGADAFRFRATNLFQRDRITDFESGLDHVFINGGFGSFDLLNIRESGTETLVQVAPNLSIQFDNIAAGDLSADDFTFL